MTIYKDHQFKPGNQAAKKLVTDEEKMNAYQQYCEYIASGKPKAAWRWRYPGKTITWNTMEKYIREEPDVFDAIHKEIAHADSYDLWFTRLTDAALGDNPKANIAGMQIIFRNMFNYDAKDRKLDDEDDNSQIAQEMVMKQLKELQENSKKV